MNKPARQRSEEKKLEALNALDPAADRSVQSATIERYLADKHFRVVARAATLAGERSLHERLPDLLSAYARFLMEPIKQDPHCMAKQAIARALVSLECQDEKFFLEGIRYQQLEPTWGGSSDSAIDVRCSCAMGLVATGYSRAVPELTALLQDREWRARAGAARAISCGNPREAEALLRFKVLVGDSEPEVIGECFTGLLSIAKVECLPFVATYLADDNDGVRDFAALALGESRHPGALEHLRAAWDAVRDTGNFRAVLIRAAALHRSDVAFDWLISIIEHGTRAHADVAVEALSVFERNVKLGERVQAALANRKDSSAGRSAKRSS
jgi:HEAT repeat protein